MTICKYINSLTISLSAAARCMTKSICAPCRAGVQPIMLIAESVFSNTEVIEQGKVIYQLTLF